MYMRSDSDNLDGLRAGAPNEQMLADGVLARWIFKARISIAVAANSGLLRTPRNA